MPPLLSPWKRFFFFLQRTEEILLVILLLSMVLLGFLQILFRNVISIGLVWIDPLLRHLVLWVALLGASVATREDRHISIDLLSGHLGDRNRIWLRTIINLFAGGVCFILVRPAIEFVQLEYQAGKILALGIPIWASQCIMPVMLTVLGLRFLGKAWEAFNNRRKFSSLHEAGTMNE